MENNIFNHHHRAIMFKTHVRTISNLLKLGRLNEAKMQNIRFTEILTIWEMQDKKDQEAALKDGSAFQRTVFKKKQAA